MDGHNSDPLNTTPGMWRKGKATARSKSVQIFWEGTKIYSFVCETMSSMMRRTRGSASSFSSA